MNEKNLAPKNIEGTYTLAIEGKTVTITDEDGRTRTANCAPGDIFNLGEGVNLAMSRLHDKTIRVGDIVKVTRPGKCYTTYVDWIERNVKSVREAAFYHYDKSIEKGCHYKVLHIADHGKNADGDLCYVQKYVVYDNGEIDEYAPCYLINVEGVEKI